MAGFSGMEMLVAKMIGITPEQMREMLDGFQTLLRDLAGKLDTIINEGRDRDAKLDRILAILEAKENDDGTNGGSGGKRARRGVGASGDAAEPGSGDAAG